MSDLLTPRAYLVTLGLAKEGRGKFSAAGHAALEAAKAAGTVFAEPVKPVAKPRVAKTVKVDLTSADSDSEAAYTRPSPLAMPKVRPASDLARPVPVSRPVLRKQETLYARSPEGYTVGYDRCSSASCMLPVSVCACPAGPRPPRQCTPISEYSKV